MRNYRARGITEDNKPIFDEKYEHITVAQWLFANDVYFIHVANELPSFRKGELTPLEIRSRIIWQKQLKIMGRKKGVADILIFDPPPLLLNSIGAVMEIKALDGDEPTKDQYQFLSEMGARRYATSWWRGSEACIKWLSEGCGYGKRRQ